MASNNGRFARFARIFAAVAFVFLVAVLLIVHFSPDGGASAPGKIDSSAAEKEYIGEMRDATAGVTGVVKFAQLAADPHFNDQAWGAAITAPLTAWQTAYHAMIKLSPPPRFVVLHATIVKALGYLNSAAADADKGMEQENAPLMQHAADEAIAANQQFDAANTQIEAFLASAKARG